MTARLRQSEWRVLKVEIDPEGVVTVFAPSNAEIGVKRNTNGGRWVLNADLALIF